MQTGNEAFEIIRTTRPIQFPRDHAAHPLHRSESWQFNSAVYSDSGRLFGIQLSFVRVALKQKPQQRMSAWGSQQIYQGFFSLTNVEEGQFLSFERFSRSALGLSGSENSPPRVWLENWQFQLQPTHADHQTAFRIIGAQNDTSADLELKSDKQPFILGAGSSGDTFNDIFRYYQFSGMRSSGTIKIGENSFDVAGVGWMDHGWGELPLPLGQVVWDRFLLHLDDNRQLIILNRHRRRSHDGTSISGATISEQGEYVALEEDDLILSVTEKWKSPSSKAEYPSRWRIQLHRDALNLDVVCDPPDQERNHTYRSWSGLVKVKGSLGQRRIKGSGFVELNGY